MEAIVNYWDNVARKAVDNFEKRAKLLHYLLKYDFKDSKVLEIGCGAGVTACLLTNACGNNFEYIGTDISPVFCEQAKVKGLNIVNAMPDNLPFGNGEFDCIFAFDVLEHIEKEQRRKVMAELKRVLKAGGCMYINNPLSPGLHDKRYDFDMTQKEIGEIADDIGATIMFLEAYTINKGNWYQFIMMRQPLLK